MTEMMEMSFDLSEDQEALRQHIRSFVEEEIKPVALQYDESQEFPTEIFKKLGELAAAIGLFEVDRRKEIVLIRDRRR